MKRHLLIFFLALLPLLSFSQNEVFSYNKKDSLVILKSDKTNIALWPSTKTKTGTVERLVNVNGHEYRFILKKTPAGKIQEVTDSMGVVRATVLLYGDNRYSFSLPNGEFIKWKPIDKEHWSYQINDYDIITGAYQKVHGQKQIDIQITNPSKPLDAIIPIIFLERTSHIVGSTYPKGVLIGLGLGLAIISAASSASQSN